MKSGRLVNLYAGAVLAATLGLSGSVFAEPPPQGSAPSEAKKLNAEKTSVEKPAQPNVGATRAVDAKVNQEKPGSEKEKSPHEERDRGVPGKALGKMSKAERKAFQTRLKELNSERKISRKERAQTEREKLKQGLGAEEPSAALRNELRNHAWRVARLSRLLELAQARESEEPTTRIQELQKKEQERHERHVAELKAQGLAYSKAGAGTPDAAKAGAVKPDAAKAGAVKPNATKTEAGKTAAPEKKESL